MNPAAAPYLAGALIALLSLLLNVLADARAKHFADQYAVPYGADAPTVSGLMTTHFSWASDLSGGALAPLSAVVGVTIAVEESRDANLALLAAVVLGIGLFVLAWHIGPNVYEDWRKTTKVGPFGLVGLIVNALLALVLVITG